MGGFSTVTMAPSGAPSGSVSVNATSIAQAVWSYSPRSLTEIQSLTAAIQNNNPNILSSLSDILYVPALYFIGQVSITQVAAFLDNLVLNYGLAGPVAAAISVSPYGLWSTDFVTQLIPYLSVTSLAQVLSSSQMNANRAQLILYWLAQNYYYNKWIYTVTANAPSSIIFSTDATLSTNVLIAQNITIASGVTVTCGTQTCFFIAQSFNNYGTVVNGNGAKNATGPGTGGGGIVIIAGTNDLGSIVVAGGTGGPARSVYIGGTGVLYVVGQVEIGIGGAGAFDINAAYQGAGGAPFGVPGTGGGGNSGSTGGPVVLYSFLDNNSMLTYILQGLSDWWLLYVLSKSPASMTPLPYMYGAGGGGGMNANGGGEGGEVVAYGYVVVGGNINAQGGGSDGTYGATGSGGGGGGVVYVFYGLTAGSVSINVAGGNGGNASYPGGTGGTGIAVLTSVTVNG
jgi:hypothetical protein